MRKRYFQWFREQRGQTLVEFALILPLLLLMILGVIEFGRLFYGFSTLQNAVRFAADVASKAPPHIGDPVPNDPEGRYNAAPDPPNCGQPGEEDCYLANIRSAARRYTVLFPPQDPHIQVRFVPVGTPPDQEVSNRVGGVVEVGIEYSILPITPVLRDMAPLGVPIRVSARRTIINLDFPYEVVTPILQPPPPTMPTNTPAPGCGGKYTYQNEQVAGKWYRFEVTNVSAGDGRGIVGLIVGWCAELGQLESLTVGGVSLLGGPANPPAISLPGGGLTVNQGETMLVEMRFQNNLNQLDPSRWPAWHLTFDDYCALWSPVRSCPHPTPTELPTQTPTSTPLATSTPTPWPTGTIPPLCGMYISSGPVFAGEDVIFQLTNSGTSSPILDSAVAMWGPGWYPLQSLYWDGAQVWSGTKYYSGRLTGLSGDFPAGSTRELRFHFGSGPITWLSFQALFDNGCYVSYSDPYQPTPVPMPTLTPTPEPGVVFLQITDLAPQPPACATNSLNARAIAYYPPAGSSDGAGIQQVEFKIYNPVGTMVYQRSDTQAWYCLGSGSGPCTALSLGNNWPGTGQPVISGTHTLEVTAYTTSGWGSYQRTETATVRVCRVPVHVEIASFEPGGCATDHINAWAIAWDPQVCGSNCSDGDGISNVYFDITKGGQLVYRHREGAVCYCAGSGNCPCPDVDFGSGSWPSSDAGSNIPVTSGWHTLTVQAQAQSGRTGEVSHSFEVCWDPCTPFVLVSEARSGSRTVTVTIRNRSGQDRWVQHVYLSEWPAAWGGLNRITVIGQNYTVDFDEPPADLACDRRLRAGQQETVVFRFDNSVGDDMSSFTGHIMLDNGCQIDF